MKPFILFSSFSLLISPLKVVSGEVSNIALNYQYLDKIDYIYFPNYDISPRRFVVACSFASATTSKKQIVITAIYQYEDSSKSEIIYQQFFSSQILTINADYKLSYLDADKVTIAVKLYSSLTFLKDSQSFEIYKDETTRLNPLINNSYSFSDNYLIYNGSSYYRLGEYFSFINMSQEYEAINPYYLDVSKMRFSYINDNNKSFAYEKASLICYDPDNLFKNLYNTDESSFSLELEINKIDNNIYSFSFRDYLYVNKFDLTTSFIESKDSYMTDKLYFPINKVDQLKKMDFVIFVEGVGQVGYEMEYILNYTYETELISLEKESEYNIASHSATPDFTLGNTYYYG